MGPAQDADITPPAGRLAVLLPGLGAVATTTIAGCFAARRGLGRPVGSLCEMGRIRLGKRTEDRAPRIRDYVPLAELDDLVFGGWDIFPDDAYTAAKSCGVLSDRDLEPLRGELESIAPMPAAFERAFVKNLDGAHVKAGGSKMELAEAVMDDIRAFCERHGCARAVVIWCGSTEVYRRPRDVHGSLGAFEAGLRASDAAIAPSQIYAYAALKLGVPFANGAPNLAADVPALAELARASGAPVAGKDFKTGQTLLKTILAPGFKARLLGLDGWYSTNILGNRDGEVLDDPRSFKSKEVSKLGVLDHILQPEHHPGLYDNFSHVVRINYYPPRGDNKEGWDSIDLRGWMDYPIQIKVNMLCRDSILAAPLVLDLALFLDFARRAGMRGAQEWLSFYFKSPITPDDRLYPEHDIFIQLMKLKNTLRYVRGDELITHLGAEYYD